MPIHITIKNFAGDIENIVLDFYTDVRSLRHLTAKHLEINETNIILFRQKGDEWERLGNFHTLQDDEEISYFIRQSPGGILVRHGGVWSILGINNRIFFRKTNDKFVLYGIEGNFDRLEDLLDTIETKYPVSDILHMWDIHGR